MQRPTVVLVDCDLITTRTETNLTLWQSLIINLNGGFTTSPYKDAAFTPQNFEIHLHREKRVSSTAHQQLVHALA